MARQATGIDVGSRTAVCVRGRVKGNTFALTRFAIAKHADGVGTGWEALELGFKPDRCRIGISGRDVNVRYTRVPRVPDWQLRKLMRFEVEEVGDQSETRVASDFNVLPEIPEIEGEDVVLLAMARESLLEEHLAGLAAVGGKLDAFTPNPIALYNAWLRYGVLMDDTVLVANIGHENLDVILARGTDLLFARNLTGGSKLFDDALVQTFGASAEKAEGLKRGRGTLAPGADPAEEKIGRALMAPAGQLTSLLQSTVAFCKSQVRLSGLKLDRVMICGGGAALSGLDRYLSSGLGVPVDVFDPFGVLDVSALDPAQVQLLEEYSLEAVCALGLATAASDPESYSVEIVPARVAARRELWGGKAFLIAAALLGMLYVAHDAWRTKSEFSSAQTSVRQLKSQLDRARRAHNQTEEVLAENADLAALGRELYAMAGAGEQAVRAIGAVHDALPEAFWLTSMTEDWGFDEELGVERGSELPVLHFEGRAREGTESVAAVFREFVEEVEAELPEARTKSSLGATFTSFTMDVCLLAPDASEPVAESMAGDELPEEEEG